MYHNIIVKDISQSMVKRKNALIAARKFILLKEDSFKTKKRRCFLAEMEEII